jgi:hypothetical protein
VFTSGTGDGGRQSLVAAPEFDRGGEVEKICPFDV